MQKAEGFLDGGKAHDGLAASLTLKSTGSRIYYEDELLAKVPGPLLSVPATFRLLSMLTLPTKWPAAPAQLKSVVASCLWSATTHSHHHLGPPAALRYVWAMADVRC